ncbi:BolA/IbaG family iron-sulfur metabolism protein [Yanghanlia caeni]|uniref:BolA family protein n=1 Tax=Yanghanlia caeni TaxID=3064283 RepID=A0ABU1D3M2_9BURK|nr:BolA family protein [Alcaligenaceae bacterium LG-2]NGR07558.1 BolA family transcriptional regulator [bacterium SGD-2]HZH56094.1 BolA family protein [Burkholderiaceae bacterium]
MTTERIDLIRERLAALEPVDLEIIDESHLHVGHAGARDGAGHYRVRIVSPRFEGLRPVASHRLVYDLVRDLMPHPIHALAIDARAAK